MANPLDYLFRQLNDLHEEEENGHYHSTVFGSNYQVHQDQNHVSIDVEVPGVAAKDLTVDVVQPNPYTCVVRWKGERKQVGRQPMLVANRIRLGPQVDCDQLAANLSHGILRLTAPIKEAWQTPASSRSIPIQQTP
jgi:HSP20 family molecular chaperone IbpA